MATSIHMIIRRNVSLLMNGNHGYMSPTVIINRGVPPSLHPLSLLVVVSELSSLASWIDVTEQFVERQSHVCLEEQSIISILLLTERALHCLVGVRH